MRDNVQYNDFVLELRDWNQELKRFSVAVLPSPLFGDLPSVTVPYDYEELRHPLRKLENKRLDLDGLKDLGKKLAELLFPNEVRNHFIKAIERSDKNKRIRVRLIFREIELAQLPWEYVYLKIHDGGEDDTRHFLALNPLISIARHEALPESYPDLESRENENLRLLAVTAQAEGYPELDLSSEQAVIEKALNKIAGKAIAFDYEPFYVNPTIDELICALLQKPDIFHFAGHGLFDIKDIDAKTGKFLSEGQIVLIGDKKTKSPAYLAAGKLAIQLRNSGVRVAVLGACESGRRDGTLVWSGIAPALIEQGVPVVVAMQYKVLDQSAIVFSRLFYESLASGLTVDEAVTAGRLAMFTVSNENNFEWGVPVLYMRSTDGVLFPRLQNSNQDLGATITTTMEQIIKVNTGMVIGQIINETSKLNTSTHSKIKIEENFGISIGIVANNKSWEEMVRNILKDRMKL